MSEKRWQNAPEGKVHERVLAYVSTVERTQCDIYERMLRCAVLYDPNDPAVYGTATIRGDRGTDTAENVVASTVDTVVAATAATEVRARFLTDDADWSEQRRARHLEWYAGGLSTKLGLPELIRQAFKDATIRGAGLVKIVVAGDRIVAERVLVDDLIVDEQESRGGGKPRQLHQRCFVDRHELADRFPDHAAKILKLSGSSGSRRWAGYRPILKNQVVVLESWSLPCGDTPGRHTICLEGIDLLDEEWTVDGFPFARIAWSERSQGWYPISLVERIAGHQRLVNKRAWQIDRQLDQHAVPTTYVSMADANLTVKTTNRAGTIVPIKGSPPQTIIPQAVSGETYQDRERAKAAAYEDSGVSRMAATAMKPAGLDSGVALREYKDQTTQRFAIQEKALERAFLDAILLAIGCAKELGPDAPVIVRKSRFGRRRIKWADVDLGDLEVQIAAASVVSRTPAGRIQQVLEWAQAGLISVDESRRLMRHPDLERQISLYTAAIEDIEATIEEIFDGRYPVPEPYQNLQMGVMRMQQSYLLAKRDGAPEPILEGIRQWIVQATYLLNRTGPQAALTPQPTPIPGPEAALAPA